MTSSRCWSASPKGSSGGLSAKICIAFCFVCTSTRTWTRGRRWRSLWPRRWICAYDFGSIRHDRSPRTPCPPNSTLQATSQHAWISWRCQRTSWMSALVCRSEIWQSERVPRPQHAYGTCCRRQCSKLWQRPFRPVRHHPCLSSGPSRRRRGARHLDCAMSPLLAAIRFFGSICARGRSCFNEQTMLRLHCAGPLNPMWPAWLGSSGPISLIGRSRGSPRRCASSWTGTRPSS